MKSVTLQLCCALLALTHSAASNAYEINNHADMSQEAILRSVLQLSDGQPERETKLFKLGLKAFLTTAEEQSFPLKQIHPFGPALGPIPYCFGSTRPFPDWKVTVPYGDPNYPTGQKVGEDVLQPFPPGATTLPKLTLAQMIRYGACYEDEEEPNARSVTHFYNPQDGGSGTVLGASSMRWMLDRNAGPTFKSGVNHYTWPDARDAFYNALTSNWPSFTAQQRQNARQEYWGQTFQALGHIVHHLQDMGSPQHVRSDNHCNKNICSYVGAYRPSGYETFFENQFRFVKGLAASATAPMVFGLPREFWNANTNDSLTTTSTTAYMGDTQGIAAYTSTNFTSVGTDFRVLYDENQGFAPRYFSAAGLALPRPSGNFEDVNVTQLFPPESAPTLAVLCGGSTTNCNMRFMGTSQEPLARTSAVSIFARDLLVPKDPNNPNLATYTGTGTFTQNFFTYQDAGKKLVPKAVDYSAGLINYFFRGDFSIRPPEEGLYGLLDGGDTNSNCKDTCGFRKIRARVANTTAPINGAVQDMTAGTLTAVVKFSRNSCYQPDWSGEIGELGTISPEQQSGCYLGGGAEPVEEIVLSQPITVSLMAVGAEQEFTFDFTANVIPINAWNIKLQVVFRGTLGAEPNAVAVSTVQVSAPTVFRYINETDWMDINQHIYRTADVLNSLSLLSAAANPACMVADPQYASIKVRFVFDRDVDDNYLYDANGAHLFHYDWLCFPEQEAIRSHWRSAANGALLATSKRLYKDTQSVLVALGNQETEVVPFSLTYPPTAAFPSLQLPERVQIFDFRVLHWNAATSKIESNQFWNYRGMHTSMPTAAFWAGGTAATTPPWQELKSRPPISSPVPIPFNFIDPRYQ